MDSLPPDEKMQLMSAFNGGFSYRVESDGYYLGVYPPPNINAIEARGHWALWRKE